MEVVRPLPIEYAWKSFPGHAYREVRSASLALALALGLGGCGGLVPQARSGVVSTVGEIRGLPAPLTAAVDVKLTGTVTFFNSALDQAWVQDATGGVRVDRIGLDPLIHVGDVVELTGRATMGGSAPIVLRETLRVVSPGTPPPPIRVTAADVAEGRHQYPVRRGGRHRPQRVDGFARPPGADAAHRRPGSHRRRARGRPRRPGAVPRRRRHDAAASS